MRRTHRFSQASLIGVILAFPAFAQRDAKIPDPDPEIERKTFQLPPGFEVNLFAADPLLAKPIHMNFDARGRLWIASSETYPQIEPGKKANDKVIILEDTDNDGKADKTTVFADGLFIPTGIEPGDGGVYVANSTEMLHIAETKDGKAGATRVLLSGFGTEDTHHIIHSFRWGHDGNLYFNQSIYIHSHIETPYGVRRLNAGGIWQYRPETNRLEVFARGWVNSWGHHFDRWGQSFATDGAYGEGINYVLPGAYYVTAVGAGRILSGLNPGQPKHCGLEVVSGRHLPDDWQGNLITNDFRGHRVNRFALKEDGAAYLSQQMPDLIRSTHPAFRPIDVKMGPDGAIYIADWYNPIIQHGEVDFRDPRRDKTHGRIWRITAKNRPLVPRPKLVDATVPELLEQLKAPEDWTRHQAKRVLKERGEAAVLPELRKWIADLDGSNGADESHLLEALWVYQSLDHVESVLLQKLLSSKDHRVRAAAVRVLSHWQHRLNNPGKLLDEAISDEHLRVRLEAVRASAAMPSLASAERALKALDKPVDRWLDYALWLTARDLEQEWMPRMKAGENVFKDNINGLIFAIEAAGSKDAIKPLKKLAESTELPPARRKAIWIQIARIGGPEDIKDVLQMGLSYGGADHELELLKNLEANIRKLPENRIPKIDATTLYDSVAGSSGPRAQVAARLMGLLRQEFFRSLLEQRATNTTTASVEDRKAGMVGLVYLGGPKTREFLTKIVAKDQPALIRRSGVEALAAVDLQAAAKAAAELLPAMNVADDSSIVFTAFLERKGGAVAIAKALTGVKLPVDVAKVGMRTLRLSGTNSPELVAVLTQAGALAAPKRTLSAAEMKQFIADVQTKGDAARGEAVFRRADMLCFKCHSIGGSGGQVGSDILSLGTSAQLEYIVDSVLQPNKNVKEGFNAVRIDLKDGKQVSGVKLRETPTEVTLRDAEDREVVVPKNKIDETVNVGSLMPEGLIDPLTRDELVDLVRFLSELGKGPYAVGTARRVRTWQVLQATKEAYTPLTRVGMHALAGNEPTLTWTPAYSSVAGALPLGDMPRFQLRKGFQDVKTPVGFTRFRLDVSAAGAAKLKFNSVAGLQLWLDGTAVPLKTETALDLTVGIHNIVIAVDMDQRREPLSVELEDIANSAVRVRIIGGK